MLIVGYVIGLIVSSICIVVTLTKILDKNQLILQILHNMYIQIIPLLLIVA